jgi:hypothetical protein
VPPAPFVSKCHPPHLFPSATRPTRLNLGTTRPTRLTPSATRPIRLRETHPPHGLSGVRGARWWETSHPTPVPPAQFHSQGVSNSFPDMSPYRWMGGLPRRVRSSWSGGSDSRPIRLREIPDSFLTPTTATRADTPPHGRPRFGPAKTPADDSCIILRCDRLRSTFIVRPIRPDRPRAHTRPPPRDLRLVSHSHDGRCHPQRRPPHDGPPQAHTRPIHSQGTRGPINRRIVDSGRGRAPGVREEGARGRAAGGAQTTSQ